MKTSTASATRRSAASHNRKIDAHDAEKLGCEQLWTVRNGIYHARGYCFKTERAREAFGNQGCQYDRRGASAAQRL